MYLYNQRPTVWVLSYHTVLDFVRVKKDPIENHSNESGLRLPSRLDLLVNFSNFLTGQISCQFLIV